MRCTKCSAEGIAGKKFCAECGSPLSNLCPRCGSDHPADAKFFADCGAALAVSADSAAMAPSQAASAAPNIRVTLEQPAGELVEGERKTVTALFADIKGSMDLAHHYSRTGNVEKAVEYLGRAGQQAALRSTYIDGIRNLTTAIDLIQKLPDEPGRARR